jgi:glutaredoxin
VDIPLFIVQRIRIQKSIKGSSMKQQCHISFVYSTILVLACGLIFYVIRGDYLQAFFWIFFVVVFLRLYVRYFPSLSRSMGYGSVADQAAKDVGSSNAKVVLYTGIGCPFCPLVKRRLSELQLKMGFELKEIDITFKPDLLISKGIRALPVVEVGKVQWIGNATSEQLADFIRSSEV